MKTDKAEAILKKMKAQGRKPMKPYEGPPDMDFIISKMTEGTGQKVLDDFNQSTLDKVSEITTVSRLGQWRR